VDHGTKASKQPEPPTVAEPLWSGSEQQSPCGVPQPTLDLDSQGPTRVTVPEVDLVRDVSQYDLFYLKCYRNQATIPFNMVPDYEEL